MVTLSKTFEFSASHKLCNLSWSEEKNNNVFGKCVNVHGHNYTMEVTISGKINSETGMILNASLLDEICMVAVVNEVDHKNLNSDVLWLSGVKTSTENLVGIFSERIQEALNAQAPGVSVHHVRLWETKRIFAEYTKD